MSTAALRRFIAAVRAGKRPAAADARLAAAFIREAIGESGHRFLPRPAGPGRPAIDNKSFRDPYVQRQVEAALALARRIDDRDPTKSDYDAVAEDRGVSARTLERYWRGPAAEFARSIVLYERALAKVARHFRRQ